MTLRRIGPRTCTRLVRCTLPIVLGIVGGTDLRAQLPGANAAALAMGGNYVAVAVDQDAVAWNPAALALTEDPRPGLTVLAAQVGGAVEPVGLRELRDVRGTLLSDSRKRAWLERIRAHGHQAGSGRLDLTYLAARIGPVAFQLSTTLDARADLSPDAAELLLFGNAGYTGDPRDFALAGESLDLRAASTAAVSYAHRIDAGRSASNDGRLALGATLKYTIGHLLVTGADRGSTLTADPLRLSLAFPVAQTDTDHWKSGSGIGVDAGVGWRGGPWTVAMVMRNIVQTFAWDPDRIRFRQGDALLGTSGGRTDFALKPLSEAPTHLRRRIERLGFPRGVALGAAVRPRADLVLAADVRHDFDATVGTGRSTRAGIGLEYRGVGGVPLRAGAARVADGYQVGAGMGVELGPLQASIAVARQSIERSTSTLASVSVAVRGRPAATGRP